MPDYLEDYEVEVLENTGREVRLPADERDILERALNRALEIFSAPGETDPDEAFQVIEALEEFYPYVLETVLCDRIGEVIELLHEISEGVTLDFEEAQDGKRRALAVAEALGMEVTHHEF